MSGEELRIGNWVDVVGKDYQVTQILEKGVNCGHIGAMYEIVNPIPITEEWLESVKGDGSFRLKFIKSIAAFEVERKYTSMHGEEWIFISNCRYRHEWQNLHFALTGEELQTDETDQKVK